MMRRFFFLLLFSASALAQAPPPVINAIVPATGPASGGTTVTITGDHLTLPPNFACLLPCPARITFGDARATLIQETATVLVVTTPSHAAGGVNVTVVTGDQRTVTATNAFLYTDDAEAGYERILLPIYLEAPAPGSNGSLWQTQLWLRSNGANSITLAPWPCPIGALCVPVFPLTRLLQPHETLFNLPQIPQTNIARLLYVNRDGAADLSAGLRLYENTRSGADAGTEIPIVRENRFLSTASHFHAVPLDARFRVMVRIYEVGVDDAQFRVSAYEEAAGVVNGAPLAQFELRAVSPETGTFRVHPAYAEYGTLASLLNSPVPRPSAVRVDVEPLTPGSRHWAFVSITNNETERVTLVTPQ